VKLIDPTFPHPPGSKQLPKPKEVYEALSRTDLECHRCGKALKNIPLLKEHMEEEWEILKANAKV
jgi:hypothetical protein